MRGRGERETGEGERRGGEMRGRRKGREREMVVMGEWEKEGGK